MRYDIGELIAKEFLLSKDLKSVDMTGYECDEGKADALCIDESGCHVLVNVETHRKRGVEEPKQVYNVKRMRRVLMCYLADHPEVKAARYDHILTVIYTGNGAEVTYTPGLASKER